MEKAFITFLHIRWWKIARDFLSCIVMVMALFMFMALKHNNFDVFNDDIPRAILGFSAVLLTPLQLLYLISAIVTGWHPYFNYGSYHEANAIISSIKTIEHKEEENV